MNCSAVLCKGVRNKTFLTIGLCACAVQKRPRGAALRTGGCQPPKNLRLEPKSQACKTNRKVEHMPASPGKLSNSTQKSGSSCAHLAHIVQLWSMISVNGHVDPKLPKLLLAFLFETSLTRITGRVWQALRAAPVATLHRACTVLHTTTFMGRSATFPTPFLAASTKFRKKKFTFADQTRHIPLNPLYLNGVAIQVRGGFHEGDFLTWEIPWFSFL